MSRAMRLSLARFLRKKAEVCADVTISKRMALALARELERELDREPAVPRTPAPIALTIHEEIALFPSIAAEPTGRRRVERWRSLSEEGRMHFHLFLAQDALAHSGKVAD